MLLLLKRTLLCSLLLSSVAYAQLSKISVSSKFRGTRADKTEIMKKIEKRLAAKFNLQNVQLLNEVVVKKIESDKMKETFTREISFRQPGQSSQDFGFAGIKYDFTSCKTGETSCLETVTVELTQSLSIEKSITRLGERNIKGDMIRAISTISYSGESISTEFETLKLTFYDWLLTKNKNLNLADYQVAAKALLQSLNESLASDLK